MAFEIGGDAVIIEQGVVNIEEEDEIRHGDGEKSISKTHLKSKNDGLPEQPMSIFEVVRFPKPKRLLPLVAVERRP
jgi:hypothetical protein